MGLLAAASLTVGGCGSPTSQVPQDPETHASVDVSVDSAGPTDTGPDQSRPASDVPPVTDLAVLETDGDADGQEPLDTHLDAGPLQLTDLIADGFECPTGAHCEIPFKAFCEEGRCNPQGLCVAVPIEGCCLNIGACSESVPGPCEAVQCAAYQCQSLWIPGCCLSDADCASELPCAESTCDLTLGQCVTCSGDCACEANFATTYKPMNEATLGGNGFSQVDYDSKDSVQWQVDGHRSLSPPSALYLGDPTCRTYYTGALSSTCDPLSEGQDTTPVRVTLYSPVLALSGSVGNAGAALVFWMWSQVEPDLGLGEAEPDVLRLFIDLLDGSGGKWAVASSLDTAKNTNGKWVPLAVDLAPYSGKNVRLRMEFDSIDGQLNGFEGLYIDDFQVVDKCPGGCCEVATDCPAGPNPCIAAECVPFSAGPGSVCVQRPILGDCTPCQVDGDCEDDNPCSSHTCGASGVCETTVFCCLEEAIYSTSFEDNFVGWALTDTQPTDSVSWQTSTFAATEGLAAAYLGDPETMTFETGEPVKASCTSPELSLPAALGPDTSLRLAFDLRLETEWDGSFYLNPLGIDRLSLDVLTNTLPVEIWSSDEIGGTTAGQWEHIVVDLSPWAGSSIQVRFTFDSVDGAMNGFEGVLLDDLRVDKTCD